MDCQALCLPLFPWAEQSTNNLQYSKEQPLLYPPCRAGAALRLRLCRPCSRTESGDMRPRWADCACRSGADAPRRHSLGIGSSRELSSRSAYGPHPRLTALFRRLAQVARPVPT